MHAGRLFIYLKQYLDRRLAGAPAWQRAAAGLGIVLAGLALITAGVFTLHAGFIVVGALLIVATGRQGVAAIRRGRGSRPEPARSVRENNDAETR
jgi:hypothetical protein